MRLWIAEVRLDQEGGHARADRYPNLRWDSGQSDEGGLVAESLSPSCLSRSYIRAQLHEHGLSCFEFRAGRFRAVMEPHWVPDADGSQGPRCHTGRGRC